MNMPKPMKKPQTGEMTNEALDADCAKCAAMCCVAFAFDDDQGFEYNKPAGKRCKYLANDGLCSIHENLATHNMTSCGRYTCYGAGQYITQMLFDGKSWLDEPSLLEPMSKAFLEMTRIQDQLLLVVEAEKLNLNDELRRELATIKAHLIPEDGWSKADLDGFPSLALTRQVKAFIQKLNPSNLL